MYGWMNEFTVCVDEYISGVGGGGHGCRGWGYLLVVDELLNSNGCMGLLFL